MPIIAAAAIPAVASFIARVGVTKAAKKYAPKLIKEATAYIKKNKLIFDGKKLIKPPKGSITTATKKTTKKMNVVKKSKNPRSPKKDKKDSFDEALKKKEGAKNFNKRNKDAINPRSPKNKKKTDDSKLVENVNKNSLSNQRIHPALKSKGLKLLKYGGGFVLGGMAINKATDILKDMTKSKNTEASTFAQAFKKARKEKGPDSTFTFKGKQYSTVTMDDVTKAGFKTHREYLNAMKKK